MTTKIPYLHIRGGSSKGLYFHSDDLPHDIEARNNVLIQAMEGSTLGDSRQIDGLGGGSSLSSKVAIICKSSRSDADIDYEFVQVIQGKGEVSLTQTCGNILAGVLHFAIFRGLVVASSPTTSAIIHMVNTGSLCELVVETPDGEIATKGDTKVDGVVGTSAPVFCNYLDTEGATCGALYPTGNRMDHFNNINATCIDNGMPVVIMLAAAFGRTGYEKVEELEENTNLKIKLEAIRIEAGKKMNLGDVANKTIPKMCLIAPPQDGGDICTRMFIPNTVHEAIGVLAAVSIATAYITKDTLAFNLSNDIAEKPGGQTKQIVIEHPTGNFMVNMEYVRSEEGIEILKSGVVRTARLISDGFVFVNR